MITAEWCTTRASSAALEAFYGSDLHAEEKANLCEALTIAARVLDEGAVGEVLEILRQLDTAPGPDEGDFLSTARAVLAYLKGEK